MVDGLVDAAARGIDLALPRVPRVKRLSDRLRQAVQIPVDPGDPGLDLGLVIGPRVLLFDVIHISPYAHEAALEAVGLRGIDNGIDLLSEGVALR